MGSENQKLKYGRFPKWFKRRNNKDKACSLNEVSDEIEDEGDDKLDHGDEIFCRSLEMEPYVSSSDRELRIFVGTWNVAGRSPVGSLAVDLEEWLDIKDAADIYILGFQEIVPLKTRNVIGTEDPTRATNWNLLIGKTLNNRDGSPWLMPMVTPTASDSHQYVKTRDRARKKRFGCPAMLTPIRKQSRSLCEKAFGGSKYTLMANKKMVGVFVSVWMKKELLRKYHLSNVRVCSVACGIMGYLGNKGAVSVSMSIEGISFCFIAAHLASGEKKGDKGRRNRQVSEIFRRTSFPPSSKEDNPLTILGHDRIFWFGDLNYRLHLEDSLARHLISKQDWKALQEFDQLRRELEIGGVFEGWREGRIEFAPTYKYSSSNGYRYSGTLPGRSREKQRTPAWCDRILWYGKGVKQASYFRSESKFSDHRPVSALFSIPIDVGKARNPKIVPIDSIIPILTTPMRRGPSGTTEKEKSTLQSLLAMDREASAVKMPKWKSKTGAGDMPLGL